MKIKNLLEGLNAQQRSVPQLPAMAKAKHISVLGAKEDPKHPFAGYMVGADESVEKSVNGEYDDEAGMAHGNLHTIARAAQGLLDTIDDNENLPEWAQEKIAKVEGMLVAVWNYLQSQEEQGIDPEIAESAAWRRKEGKSKSGGLNAKGVASYRRENPGSKLQTAVTTKPSKLKPGSKAAKRRKSFCARMSGVKGPMKKPNGKPTRKALALRKWNCESIDHAAQLMSSVSQTLKEMKQRLDPKCWKGKHKEGTKIKGGIRVNNCVPNESVAEMATPPDIKAKNKAAAQQVNVKESVANEDVLGALKDKLGDYLKSLGDEVKSDKDLQDKLAPAADTIAPAVRTITTDDGREIKIHGNEDDGFHISIKGKEGTTKFESLDHAEMATKMYCAHRRNNKLNSDYMDEA